MTQEREKLLEMTESSALRVLDELESLRVQMISRGALDAGVVHKFEELERTAWSLLLTPLSRLREDFLLSAAQHAREKKLAGLAFGAEIAELWVPQSVFLALLRAVPQFLRNSFAHAGLKAGDRVELSASYKGAELYVLYRDTGRGPDWEALARSESAGSFLDEAQGESASSPVRASDAERDQLLDQIFSPGVSTAGEASLSAGRGLGLSSVRAAIYELGGSVRARAPEAGGLEFEIRIPLEYFALRVRLEQGADGKPVFSPDSSGETRYFRKLAVEGVPAFATLDWNSGWVFLNRSTT